MTGKSGNSLDLVSFDIDKALAHERKVGFYFMIEATSTRSASTPDDVAC